jgi:FlaA1/EpsC-like NDP-sugar epimerase
MMFKKYGLRRLSLIGLDALVLSLACALSEFIIQGLSVFSIFVTIDAINVVQIAAIQVVASILVLYLMGCYRVIWVYSSKIDYISCIGAIAIATVTNMTLGAFLARIGYFVKTPPNTLLAVYFVMSCLLIVLSRLIFANVFSILDTRTNEKSKKRALIVGAGDAGKSLAREIKNNLGSEYFPVCFVDDDPMKKNDRIFNIQVVGETKDIKRICKDFEIDTILFAIPSCPSDEKRKILEICNSTPCKVKIIPFINDAIFNDDQLLLAKDLKVDDLLGRDPITFEKTNIKNTVKDKICLVTGGGGSIGSELCRQIAKYKPKQLIILDIYENSAYEIEQELLMEYDDKLNLKVLITSVRDYDKLEKVFEEYHPELVFHAAAHKHVPLMETSPEEAVKNNIVGTYNTAKLASLYKVERFVLISTDKAVNPTNVMGATKRCCEMVVQTIAKENKDTIFVTVRFGNVLGSNGSVIPLFRRQIENDHPVTVTHPDIIRYFMTIPEAVSLVLEASAISNGEEVFVLDMGEPVKILTLAENVIRQYGKVPYKDVEIKFTGLRPGEKLYEELLMDTEGLKKTENNRIFIGDQSDIDTDEFLKGFDELKAAANNNDSQKVVELLKQIVPTFNHKPRK